MHKNCSNEQFLVFMMGDIAAEAAWELSLRLGVIAFGLGVIAFGLGVKRTIGMLNGKTYVLPRSGIIFAA